MAACRKVSPGRNGEMLSEFLAQGVAALRYGEFGDIREMSKEEVLAQARRLQTASNRGSQLYAFVTEVQQGDLMVTYDRRRREYRVGRVLSHYAYDPAALPHDYHHYYQVEWSERPIPREALSDALRSQLDRRGGFCRIAGCDELLHDL